jgi:hypothetical protein
LRSRRDIWLRFVIRASLAEESITLAISMIRTDSGNGIHLTYFVGNWRQRMRFQPQRTGGDSRINPGSFPPRRLIAAVVDLTVMAAA